MSRDFGGPSPEEMGIKEEQITKSREEAQDQWEMRAKARNKYRHIADKIFFTDKVSAEDIAIEMAVKMDEEINKLLEDGKAETATEAIEILNQQEEFQPKTKGKIKKEEYWHRDVLQFCNALKENDFSRANMHIFNAGIARGGNNKKDKVLRNIIDPIIGKKIVELIKNKDGKSLMEVFANFNRVVYIIKELGLSQEELCAPEIVNSAKAGIINNINKNNVNGFRYLRDEMIDVGIFTKEEVDYWPEVADFKYKHRDNVRM